MTAAVSGRRRLTQMVTVGGTEPVQYERVCNAQAWGSEKVKLRMGMNKE